MTKADIYWQEFLLSTGRDPQTVYADCGCFEISEQAANALLELVLAGKKTATSSSLRAYEAEGEPIPRVGDLSIITDWSGEPRCVIETTAVTIIPYCEMTFEICSREGEDDSLESWRRNHDAFFAADAQSTGYEFTPDMPVVFEDFRVIYK